MYVGVDGGNTNLFLLIIVIIIFGFVMNGGSWEREYTFHVEASAVFVPALEADLVAQDRQEALELFAATLCRHRKIE